MNPNLKIIQNASYEVRGELPKRANEIEMEIKKCQSNYLKNPYPFSKIIYCNIGNPLALIPEPIEEYRDLVCLTELGLEKNIQKNMALNIGAYSPSIGYTFVREEIKKFVEKRDGFKWIDDNEEVFLVNGATEGVHALLKLFIWNQNDAILLPKPCYPIYQALTSVFGGTTYFYDLNEENGWQIDLNSVKNAFGLAKKENKKIHLFTYINPNNPTGAIYDKNTLVELFQECSKNDCMIICDEVYQENDKDNLFISGRKICLENEFSVPIFSLHSISKGFIGECGHRGGYLQTSFVDKEILVTLDKWFSMRLSPNSVGQLFTYAMVKLPFENNSVKNKIENKKKEYIKKSDLIVQGLNQINGISCQIVSGAMYVFPKVNIPNWIKEKAQKNNRKYDFQFCYELLEQFGICVVPGSGFGQKENTFHFRMTLLPKYEELEYFIKSLNKLMNS